jgi:hypothetical protein
MMDNFPHSPDLLSKSLDGCEEKERLREREAASRRFKTELERTPEIPDEKFMAEFEVSDEEYDRGLTVVLSWNPVSVPGDNEDQP